MTSQTEKRILIFYPHNFFEMSAGTHRRVYELIQYFKARGFILDLISINGFTNVWDDGALRKGKEFFEDIYACDWKPSVKRRLSLIFEKKKAKQLADFTLPEMRERTKELLISRKYDFFLVSYVYWEKLVDHAKGGVKTVIDLHDFITLSEYMISGRKDFTLGHMFEEEVAAINKFDYALSISEEETLVFEPFCSHARFVHVPMAFEERFQETEDCKYDLMFIGSDNPFNRDGILWFMDKVYHLLPGNLRIAIVGKVAKFVEGRPNIVLIPYAEDLKAIYNDTRAVFCPLLGGTGLKVKVVEALSYGKPVVTTRWGLSGMLCKEDNGCLQADNEREFAAAIEKLLRDKVFYLALKRQAMEYFRRRFDKASCWDRLDSIFLA